MRLLLGDCFDVLPSVPDGSVDMVFCDLPYAHHVRGHIRGCTKNYWDTPIDIEQLWPSLLRVSAQQAAFIFTATQPFAAVVIQSCPTLFRYDLIWSKSANTGFANANCRPLPSHESILVFSRATCNPQSGLKMTYNPQKVTGKPYQKRREELSPSSYGKHLRNVDRHNEGWRHPKTILHIDKEATARGQQGLRHPTQKPVALLEWLIKTYTNPGDTVLDPCAGIFTTAVAAHNVGRDAICIEQSKEYYDIGVKRVREAKAAPKQRELAF